jgi:aminopeptidase
MTDPRIDNLARILVTYSTGVQSGDWVLIRAGLPALPLLKRTYYHVLKAGGQATIIFEDDALTEMLLKEGSDEQIAWIPPTDGLMLDQVDVNIRLKAVENTRQLTGVDPAKSRLYSQSRSGMGAKAMRRAAQGEMRWVLTQFPCAAFAQDADMSLDEFENFVYSATFADQPDPIRCWQDLHDEQQRLVDWLEGKKQVHIKGPNADLSLSIEGRPFKNSSGKTNMPSGEIFTGPVENSAQGWIRFTYPAVRLGREVSGVEFQFAEGRLISAQAEKNEAYLLTMLDTDPGARYLGEFAFGTNYGIQRFVKSILYDEKIGGSIHIAIGAGYPETGSQNKSGIHWDFICDMRTDSEVWVDGELFYRNGQFQI